MHDIPTSSPCPAVDGRGFRRRSMDRAITINNLDAYKASLPFIRSAATLMKAHMPERYEAQLQASQAGQADYIIPSTPFSTVTINRDVTAAYHTDQGDYRPGIGIIAATWAKKTDKGWEITAEDSAAGGLLVYCNVAPAEQCLMYVLTSDTKGQESLLQPRLTKQRTHAPVTVPKPLQ